MSRSIHLPRLVAFGLIVGACSGAGTPAPTATTIFGASASATPSVASSDLASSTPELCQPEEPECLGQLAPGLHSTSAIITPFTYRVPAGWSKTLDVPGSVNIETAAFPSAQIGVQPDWVIVSQSACSRDPESGLGRSVGDLVDWLTEHPGLVSTQPSAVTLGGLQGQVLDIQANPAWTGPCPDQVSLFTHVGTINDPGWWVLDESDRMRFYFLESGDSHVVSICVWTTDAASFDDFVQAATPVVESFEFTPSS